MMHEQEVLIPADHPSLEGHFPGHPVVPGVVILDELRKALQGWREGAGIAGLTQVKFNAPLFPGEPLRVEFEDRGGRVAFRAFCADRLIAQGEFVIRQA
jgi:3-hydroxyacyl-[acyl-carrier-protein] dehydratase